MATDTTQTNPVDTVLNIPPLTGAALLAGGLLLQVFEGDTRGKLLHRAPLGMLANVAAGTLGGWALFTLLHSDRSLPIPGRVPKKLVQGGPYSTVRHPMYLAMLIAMFGNGRVLGLRYANLLPILAIYTAYLRKHAQEEDELLAEHFGDDFRAYRQVTPSGLPFVK
jgi:protein-S-isoprenylcysteine O-methyltransferase Ste14